MSTFLNIWLHLSWSCIQISSMCNISQHLADYSIIIYKPFVCLTFFSVGQMYIKPGFLGWNRQPRNRHSDRWALLANTTYLNSPKDDAKLVSKLVKLPSYGKCISQLIICISLFSPFSRFTFQEGMLLRFCLCCLIYECYLHSLCCVHIVEWKL